MENIREILKSKSLRPTKQRMLIASYLFDGCNKHITAEDLYKKLKKLNLHVSLATVYNTLHGFCEKKLLNKVPINSDKTYFDTNMSHHHHFYAAKEQLLIDVSNKIKVKGLPKPPKGKKINKVEVIVHLKK
jgi:Fur family iron response transcriptional regulator